jgi:hypothetical protein
VDGQQSRVFAALDINGPGGRIGSVVSVVINLQQKSLPHCLPYCNGSESIISYLLSEGQILGSFFRKVLFGEALNISRSRLARLTLPFLVIKAVLGGRISELGIRKSIELLRSERE